MRRHNSSQIEWPDDVDDSLVSVPSGAALNAGWLSSFEKKFAVISVSISLFL